MRKRLLALSLALLLLLAGCSGGEELGRRALVTAVAVSRREEGGFRLLAECLTHAAGGEERYEAAAGEGESFAQAVMDLEEAAGRTLYLDGCRLLLVEGFRDREELRRLLGEVDAHGGIRPLTLVAASPESAGLLEEKPEEGESAGEEIFSLLTAEELSRVDLLDALNLLDTPGRGLLLPVVVRREGRAAVRGYLSAGEEALLEAPPETARLLPFARSREGSGRVRTLAGEGYSLDWVLEKSRLRVRPREEGGRLILRLEAEVEGQLLSVRGEAGEGLLARAQEDLCRELLEEYAYVLEELVRVPGNDLFSFGKRVEILLPALWREVGEDWPAALAEAGVELHGSALLQDRRQVLSRAG